MTGRLVYLFVIKSFFKSFILQFDIFLVIDQGRPRQAKGICLAWLDTTEKFSWLGLTRQKRGLDQGLNLPSKTAKMRTLKNFKTSKQFNEKMCHFFDFELFIRFFECLQLQHVTLI
jgi:hypothetical protein